jgi:hypothetical protein
LVSAIEVVDAIFGADADQLKTVLTVRLRFQHDRGRRFSVIMDGHGCAEATWLSYRSRPR